MKVEILTDYLYLLTTDIKYKLSVKISTFIEIIYLKRCSEMKWTLYWKRYYSITSMLYL